jgi:hypothetical protein
VALTLNSPVASAEAAEPQVLAEEEVLPLPPPSPPPMPHPVLASFEPRATLASVQRPIAAPARVAAPHASAELPAVAAPVATVAPRPQPPRPRTYAIAAPAAPMAPEPPVRSMLGGASTTMLAPPVPFGAANAATYGGYGR